MLTPLAHMRLAGDLLNEMCNTIMVLQAFLKGHVETIVAMIDHSHHLRFFMNLAKFIWKVKHNAFFMILIVPGGRLTKRCNRNCQFQQGFCMIF